MHNFIVTGSNGFIGSAVAAELGKYGDVTGIDNRSTNDLKWSYKYHKRSNVKNLDIIDLSDYSEVDNLFKHIAFCEKDLSNFSVVHLAAKPRVQYSFENAIKSNASNIDSTLNLLECCKNFGIKRFVYSSSSSVYGDQPVYRIFDPSDHSSHSSVCGAQPLYESMIPNPLSPYALQKLAGEYYCRIYANKYNMECISLRYFNVYGRMQNPTGGYPAMIPKFISSYLAGNRPTIYGDGEQTRDWTYLDDVVSANVAAVNCKDERAYGEVFNIGNGNNVSVNDIDKFIRNELGVNLQPLYGDAVTESKHTKADISKSKEILKWEPKVRVEDGLRDVISDMKGN